jgi:lysophospholipase L1-like esterase
MKRVLRELAKALLAVVLVNATCFVGEVVAYGTWYSGDRPARLYVDPPGGGLPQLKPGVHLPGLLHDISVNSAGFRGPELGESEVRLWCIGGSTTFDIYAPDDASTWPALLASDLGERWGAKVDVVNGGIPGETYLGGLDRVQASDLKPDILVLYTGPNELAQIQMWVAGGDGAEGGLNLAALRVARRLFPLPPRTPVEYAGRTLEPSSLDKIRRELRVLRGWKADMDIVLVTHAFRAQPGDVGEVARERVDVTSRLLKLPPEATIEAMDAYNQVIRETASAEGLNLVDLRPQVDGDPQWWGDSVHFSAAGSARAAELLAEALEPLHPPKTSAR